jgi:hypothetical protein
MRKMLNSRNCLEFTPHIFRGDDEPFLTPYSACRKAKGCHDRWQHRNYEQILTSQRGRETYQLSSDSVELNFRKRRSNFFDQKFFHPEKIFFWFLAESGEKYFLLPWTDPTQKVGMTSHQK